MARLWITGISIFAVLLLPPLACRAQDDRHFLKASQVPIEGRSVRDFVPAGWMIEQQIRSDLNHDSISDVVLKLVEKRSGPSQDDNPPARYRAMVVLFGPKNGKLHRVALADRLLECTRCGGAFYGVSETPANVEVRNGVIIVTQTHGSREVTDLTFRFRYDPVLHYFRLIGMDSVNRDRATGETVEESSNYLTGVMIRKSQRYNEKTQKDVLVTNLRKNFTAPKKSMEQIDFWNY